MLFGRVGDGADFQRLVAIQDAASGLRGFIALHSLAAGPAFGGVRRIAYEGGEEAALADALRLAASMTAKCLLAGLPAGGAKTVILDHPALDRRAAYVAIGRVIASLSGTYVCGPDVGTGEAELEVLRGETSYVNPRDNDAAAATAAGVLAGLRGLLRVTDGDEVLGGRHYLIQGLGAVGSALARALVAAGAEVSAYDPDERACAAAAAVGVRILGAAQVTTTPCEVFMPCALGGDIDGDVAASAPWGAVCGCANNQLRAPEVGEVLHARRIPWAPDVVVNAGAVIEGVLSLDGPAGDGSRARIRAAIDGIADTCEAVLREAAQRGVSPGRVARERADLLSRQPRRG